MGPIRSMRALQDTADASRSGRPALADGASPARTIVLASIVVLGCAGDPSGIGPPDGGSARTIRGRVVAADETGVSNLQATWRARGGSGGTSAPVGSDGTFEIVVDGPDPAGELLIDGVPPRRFHPFLYPLHLDSVSNPVIVIIPRRWTIRSGDYRGQTVDTPLDPVVDDDADNYLYSYFWGQGDPRPDPVRYLLDLASWPAGALPARVAFDRQGGANPVSPQDSALIWDVLDRMESVFGLDLFEPGVADPSWWPRPWTADDPGYVPGVIRVIVDPPAWHGVPLGDSDPDAWDQALGPWADAGRFDAFRVRRRRLDGGVLVVGAFEPLQLADGPIPWETVLMHEVLHVFGVGHTCRVPSPQGPCMRTADPSPRDVAYMELLREALRIEGEGGAFRSIMPAVIGERRVLLGLPALPTVDGVPNR
jgi:hypothetical protein